MRIFAMIAVALFGNSAMADIGSVIDHHILPRHAAFTQSTAALVAASRSDCTSEGTTAAYHAAFDDWVAVSHIRFGPIENNGEGLAIAFWPDKKGMIPRTLTRLVDAQDPVVANPAAFASYSIAARGFFALEQMLFDPGFADYSNDSYSCDLTQAIATDLARIAAQTDAAWRNGYGETLRNAGSPDNQVFLTDKEGAQALYTNLLGGLEYIHSQRVGRPLGSFEKPRPNRAEARRSLRSMRNIIVSLESLQEMAGILGDGEALETMEGFEAARNFARTLDARVFESLHTTSSKFQLVSLQQLVAATHEAATVELGLHLGVGAGFNALDGD